MDRLLTLLLDPWILVLPGLVALVCWPRVTLAVLAVPASVLAAQQLGLHPLLGLVFLLAAGVIALLTLLER